jgi:peptide/nickel transport system permease protein
MKILESLKNLFTRLFFPKAMKKQTSVTQEEMSLSPGKIIARNFFRNKLSTIGIVVFVFMFNFTFVLGFFFPLDLYYTNALQRNLPPSWAYLNYPAQLEREGVKDIQSGVAFSLGLSEEGNVFFWGTDVRETKAIPAEVLNSNIVSISAGSQHAMAVADNGEIFFWGYNQVGQAEIPERFVDTFKNDPLVLLNGDIDKTVGITEKGLVYVWGAGASQIGNPLRASPYGREKLDANGNQIKAIDAQTGISTLIVLFEDGTVEAFGQSNELRTEMPTSLSDGSLNIKQIAVTLYNGIALDDTGKIHVWGSDTNFVNNASIPEAAKTNIKSVHAGHAHVAVVTNDGNVIAWGDNTVGQANVPSNLKDVERLFVSSYQNYAVNSEGEITGFGNRGFIAGTDDSGRNFVLQLIHGGRITMTVGAVAVLISTVIGLLVGIVSGYFGGLVDNILMRMAEVISSFPFLPLAITLSAALLSSNISQVQRILMIMVILGVLSWTGLARLIRGQVLSERERDYVLAARALGIRNNNIMKRHILPSVFNIILVSASLGYAGSLLTEAGLSFLGFGIVPPSPSWGNILSAAQQTVVIETYWWRWILPGVAIIVTALSVNLIGDALRDAMDPKSNER